MSANRFHGMKLLLLILFPFLMQVASAQQISGGPSSDPQPTRVRKDEHQAVCDLSAANPIVLKMSSLFIKLLGGLGECNCRDFPRSVREKFENDVVEDIMARFPVSENTDENPLIITSYQSGRLFQEFVIINKLIKKGYKYILFSPIDQIYIRDESSDRPTSYMNDQSMIAKFERFYNNYNRKHGTSVVLLPPAGSVQGYLSILTDENKPQVIIDVDSDSSSSVEYTRLVENSLREDGVIYRLRQVEFAKTMGHVEDKAGNSTLLKSFAPVEGTTHEAPGPTASGDQGQ